MFVLQRIKFAYMLEKIYLDLLKLLSMLVLLLRYFNCSIAGLLLKEKIEDPIHKIDIKDIY